MRKSVAIAISVVVGLAVAWHYWPATAPPAGSLGQPKQATPVAVGGGQAAATSTTAPTRGRTRPAILTLHNASDYAELLAQLAPLAAKNDSEALKTIAQIYAYCAEYSIPNAHYVASMAALAKLRPDNAERYARLGKLTEARCKNVDGGEPIPRELVELSLMQAAAAGDTYSKLKLAQREKDVSVEQVDGLVDEAFARADADAIIAATELLAYSSNIGQYPDGKYSHLSDTNTEHALAIIACRKSPAQCGPDSILMVNYCRNFSMCNYTSYEDMIIRGVNGGQPNPVFRARLAEMEQVLRPGERP